MKKILIAIAAVIITGSLIFIIVKSKKTESIIIINDEIEIRLNKKEKVIKVQNLIKKEKYGGTFDEVLKKIMEDEIKKGNDKFNYFVLEKEININDRLTNIIDKNNLAIIPIKQQLSNTITSIQKEYNLSIASSYYLFKLQNYIYIPQDKIEKIQDISALHMSDYIQLALSNPTKLVKKLKQKDITDITIIASLSKEGITTLLRDTMLQPFSLNLEISYVALLNELYNKSLDDSNINISETLQMIDSFNYAFRYISDYEYNLVLDKFNQLLIEKEYKQLIESKDVVKMFELLKKANNNQLKNTIEQNILIILKEQPDFDKSSFRDYPFINQELYSLINQ